MENWGLVTYRETRVLLSEGASPAQRQAVAETVIHEIAHQYDAFSTLPWTSPGSFHDLSSLWTVYRWFGNLVTMEWWEDIWLNEGFATWMENHVCDLAHPDWSKWAQFVATMQGGALARDAQRSSHPIQMPMARAEQVGLAATSGLLWPSLAFSGLLRPSPAFSAFSDFSYLL